MILLCRHSHILQINYSDSNFYCSFSYKNCKNATMLEKKNSWRRSKKIKNNWNLWCLNSYQRKSYSSQDIQYLFISLKSIQLKSKKKKKRQDTTVKHCFLCSFTQYFFQTCESLHILLEKIITNSKSNLLIYLLLTWPLTYFFLSLPSSNYRKST